MMISLETAKKLKDAGLKWEPQVGDWFYIEGGYIQLVAFQSTLEGQYTKITNGKNEHYPDSRLLTMRDMLKEDFIFAPRLDQLLAEINKRGWKVVLFYSYNACWIENEEGHEFTADSPEEATVQALLWILEQEKPKCPYCNGPMPCLTCACD